MAAYLLCGRLGPGPSRSRSGSGSGRLSRSEWGRQPDSRATPFVPVRFTGRRLRAARKRDGLATTSRATRLASSRPMREPPALAYLHGARPNPSAGARGRHLWIHFYLNCLPLGRAAPEVAGPGARPRPANLQIPLPLSAAFVSAGRAEAEAKAVGPRQPGGAIRIKHIDWWERARNSFVSSSSSSCRPASCFQSTLPAKQQLPLVCFGRPSASLIERRPAARRLFRAQWKLIILIIYAPLEDPRKPIEWRRAGGRAAEYFAPGAPN